MVVVGNCIGRKSIRGDAGDHERNARCLILSDLVSSGGGAQQDDTVCRRPGEKTRIRRGKGPAQLIALSGKFFRDGFQELIVI